ncbi:MAG: 16S rRNA (guanine(527)-N(7))-methyltransferase RsmG [Dehalococcoidia bacterium]|nr:16S rRNA (guanine(527)-N(7))-methyltransferase RsmG [Dehalococcoidia bacterium]
MLPVLVEGAHQLGIELTDDQVGQFQRFYEMLADWSERVSLTAVKDEEGVQRRHFLESAAIIAVLKAEGLSLEDRSLIDVGSGSGVPGVPLKILEPSLQLTLVEAKQRKAEFLNALLAELGLSDVNVATRRAEEAGHDPKHREQYDIAVAKALAPLRTLAELTLPFVRMGGLVLAPKGREAEREAKEASTALEVLNGSLRGIEALPLTDRQSLVLIDKVLPCPPRFPRRPGMPAKRPL